MTDLFYKCCIVSYIAVMNGTLMIPKGSLRDTDLADFRGSSNSLSERKIVQIRTQAS